MCVSRKEMCSGVTKSILVYSGKANRLPIGKYRTFLKISNVLVVVLLENTCKQCSACSIALGESTTNVSNTAQLVFQLCH